MYPTTLRTLKMLFLLPLLLALPLSALAQQESAQVPPNTVVNTLSGKTARFISERLGAGVIFFDQNGRALLWYPGQPEILSGRWAAETIRGTRGADAEAFTNNLIALYFPAVEAHRIDTARTRIGLLAYIDANQIDLDLAVKEVADGDVLRLAVGQPPCRMCSAETTFAQMVR